MLNDLRNKFNSGMSNFDTWFDSFKRGLGWESYFNGDDILLDDLPLFIQFAVFKKFFLNNEISISTREYLHKTDEFLFSYRLKYDTEYIVEGGFAHDEQAMKTVVFRAFRAYEERVSNI